jgi:hypothetical protein
LDADILCARQHSPFTTVVWLPKNWASLTRQSTDD